MPICSRNLKVEQMLKRAVSHIPGINCGRACAAEALEDVARALADRSSCPVAVRGLELLVSAAEEAAGRVLQRVARVHAMLECHAPIAVSALQLLRLCARLHHLVAHSN